MAAFYERDSDSGDRTKSEAAARVAAIPKWTSAQRTALRGAADLLERHGEQKLAAVLRTRQGSRPVPEIVVVGEAKRGKSSLVNSLLRVPDAAPVGVDITTGLFLRFRCGPPETAAAPDATVLFADGSSRSIPLAEVADWATVGGRYAEPTDGTVPIGVEVAVTGALLTDVALVDTPGVGGLDGGHSRLAMRAAEAACALIFVTDAGQPLTEPEYRFLGAASHHVDTVVFAVTKMDKHPAGAAQVLAENRELLRRYAPRFADAPIIGVSSQLAAAMAGRPPELVAALAQASGYDELVRVLQDRLADGNRVYVRNVLRSAHSSLELLAYRLEREQQAVAQDPGTLAELDDERARLAELVEQEGRWTLDFERDLRKVRSTTVALLGREADGLRNRWRQRLDAQSGAFRKSVADEVTTALRGDLMAMADAVNRTFGAELGTVLSRLDQELGAADLPPTVDRSAAGTPGAPSGMRGVLDPGLISTSYIGYNMASFGAAAALGGAATGLVAAIVAPVVGAAFLTAVIVHKQLQSGRRRLTEFTIEEITRVRTDLVAHVDDTISQIKPDVIVAVRQGLRMQMAELKRVIDVATKAALTDRRDRESRISTLETHLAAVRAQRDELAGLLDQGAAVKEIAL